MFQIPLEVFPGFWAYAYLVLVEEYAVLIDAGSGYGNSDDHLDAGFEAAGKLRGREISLAGLTHVFITHGHIDHFGGLSHVIPRTSARLGIHELDRRILTNYEERRVVVSRDMQRFLAEAGVKIGDVIVELNGKPVPKSHDFPGMIADTPPGQKLTLKLVRDRKDQLVAVKVGELADEPDATQAVEAKDLEIGLRVERITPESARRLGLNSTKGVLVVEVQAGSPADQVGLEPADVIREINQRPVNNAKDFERAVRQVRRAAPVLRPRTVRPLDLPEMDLRVDDQHGVLPSSRVIHSARRRLYITTLRNSPATQSQSRSVPSSVKPSFAAEAVRDHGRRRAGPGAAPCGSA